MPDNKARAQAFWAELFNAHDLRKIGSFLAPGSVNHNARPGTPDGPEGAGQVFSRLWAGCSDMHFDLQTTVAEGNKVVCIGVMTGTHDGPFHGIAATHRPIAARQIHVLTFNDTGLITEHLAVRDDVTVLRQLGALLPTTSSSHVTTPTSESADSLPFARPASSLTTDPGWLC